MITPSSHSYAQERPTRPTGTAVLRTFATLLALVVFAAACSSSGSEEDTSPTTADSSADADRADPESDNTETDDPDSDESGDGPDNDNVVSGEGASYTASGCEFDIPPGVDASCGTLTVPADWDTDDGASIELSVATLTSADTPTDATPVVYLDGGPGGDSLSLLQLSWETLWADLNEDRPIVVYSQRGTEGSDVDLLCEEVSAEFYDLLAVALPDDEELQRATVAFEECMERLRAEGVDPSNYNTLASAHDAEALRQALVGDEPWHVLGISYGTRLGQELLRQHPDGIASIVLDSVLPVTPEDGSVAEAARNGAAALAAIFDACSADTACDESYPDIERRFLELHDSLNSEPLAFETANPLTGAPIPVEFTGVDLVGLVFNAMYDRASAAAIPAIVAELEQGDSTTTSVAQSQVLLGVDTVAIGMQQAVLCHDYPGEDEPEPSDDELVALFESAELTIDWCALAAAGEIDPSLLEPVASDKPALVLAGSIDPITPPRYGADVAAELDNATLIEFDGLGHAVTAHPCGQEVVRSFFADPDGEVSNNCTSPEIGPLPFVPSPLGQVEFEPYTSSVNYVASGVTPVGWSEVAPGTWQRPNSNIAEATVLVQQKVPVAATATLLPAFEANLGSSLADQGEVTVEGRVWEQHRGVFGRLAVLVYLHTGEAETLVVVAQVGQDDEPAAWDNLLLPVLTAIET